MPGSNEEFVWIDAPRGARLAGMLHWPGGAPAGAVLLCHGMLSSKDGTKQVALSQALCALGHAVLRFDFQGRGQSSGDLLGLSLRRDVGDARAALAALRARVGPAALGLVGSSLGGATALLLAAESRPAGLVTVAAVGRLDRLAERLVGRAALARWDREGSLSIEGRRIGHALVEGAARVDLLGAAARVDCPWLILHGERDEVVDVEDAQALHRASGGRAGLEILPGGDHRLLGPAHLERIVARAAEFLERALRGGEA